MKATSMLSLLAVAAGLAAGAARAANPPGAPPHAALPKQVVDELTRFAKPGPQHQVLAAFAGRWTTTTRAFADPTTRPAEFAGSAESRMILGGRYLELESRSTVNGAENHGLGLYGYDVFKEKYTFYFIHDGDTQALEGLGDANPEGTRIAFEVAMDMPTTGERAKPFRAVLRRDGPDRYLFEMLEKHPDGKDTKVLEVAYDRVK
jgi:hypothetical protein